MGEAKSPAQQAFDRLIRDHVAPLLKQHGYTKSNLNWRAKQKTEPFGWRVFNVQRSAYSSADRVSFTANVGVYWDDAPVHAPRQLSAAGPKEWECHVHQRLGYLCDSPGDFWWEIEEGRFSSDTGPDILTPVLETFLPLLIDRALPWLQRRMTQRALQVYIRKFHAKGDFWDLPDSELDAEAAS
jgi:hypothetical protein